MTNRFLLLAGLAVLSSAAFAQNFTDSFENAVYSGLPGATGNTPGDTVTSVVVWDAINRSVPVGTTAWFDGNVTVFPANTGARYAAANFNNSSGASAIDNWLISPVRTFNNGDTIRFFTRTVTNPAAFVDRLRLRLSTNGASTAAADFSTVLVSVNEALTGTGYPNAWTSFTGTVSGLGGATAGRFAFAYQVPTAGPAGTNSDYIGIDDVSYTAVPEPATMAVLGLGVAALLRRRRRS